jgi:hypothetical protein
VDVCREYRHAPGPTGCLYDIIADPEERHDLALTETGVRTIHIDMQQPTGA